MCTSAICTAQWIVGFRWPYYHRARYSRAPWWLLPWCCARWSPSYCSWCAHNVQRPWVMLVGITTLASLQLLLRSASHWCLCAAFLILGRTVPLGFSCFSVSCWLHDQLVHLAFLYVDLRNAIRYENGEHVIRLWRFWFPVFLACRKSNYACEAANLLCNIQADFPTHIAYIAIHNRTVNIQGRVGYGKPIDQMIENYNL